MTTRTTYDSVETAAAAVGVPAPELSAALAAAAEAAANPSATQCTLPGPVLMVRVDLNGHLVLARREDEASDDWRFELF